MPQQKIDLPVKHGGIKVSAQKVLEFLTPLNGTAAPAINALYLGQTYIDTATPAVYKSIAVGSVAPADDWLRIDAYDA